MLKRCVQWKKQSDVGKFGIAKWSHIKSDPAVNQRRRHGSHFGANERILEIRGRLWLSAVVARNSAALFDCGHAHYTTNGQYTYCSPTATRADRCDCNRRFNAHPQQFSQLLIAILPIKKNGHLPNCIDASPSPTKSSNSARAAIPFFLFFIFYFFFFCLFVSVVSSSPHR